MPPTRRTRLDDQAPRRGRSQTLGGIRGCGAATPRDHGRNDVHKVEKKAQHPLGGKVEQIADGPVEEATEDEPEDGVNEDPEGSLEVPRIRFLGADEGGDQGLGGGEEIVKGSVGFVE